MARRRTPADPDAPPPRRMRGFEPAASLVASRLRKGAESRGFAIARLLTHWPEIAGADTAAHTRPVKVSHGRAFGATLTVLTDGAHAPLLQMQLPALRARVNAVYGFNAIARIAITQTAAHGFAEGQAAFGAPPRAGTQPPSPAEIDTAREIARRFDDPALAEAMQTLALNRAARRGAAAIRPTPPQDRKALS